MDILRKIPFHLQKTKIKCVSHKTIIMKKRNELDGSSKKALIYIKKNHSKQFLEKERILDNIESFFISAIDFYGEF